MSRTRLMAAATVVAAVALGSCGTTNTPKVADAPAAKTIGGALTADQIRSVVSGNTGYGQEDRFQWRTFYAPDGRLQGRHWGSWGEERDEGTWEITGSGQLCRQWTIKWGKRKRACFEVYKDGELIKLLNADGNDDSFEMRVLSGNKVDG